MQDPIAPVRDQVALPGWGRDASLFLLSAAVLTLEILQTKIFAYALDPIIIFMAVGVCMLGLGASATALVLFPTVSGTAVGTRSALCALLGAALVLVSHAVFARTSPSVLAGNVAGTVALLVLTLPYLCFGAAIAMMLVEPMAGIARTYAINLLGSGVGCLAIFPLLDHLGAERAIVVVAGLAVIAALCAHRPRRAVLVVVGATVVLGLAVIWAPYLFRFQPDPQGQLMMTLRRFELLRAENPGYAFVAEPLFSRWDRTARIDVYKLETSAPGLQTRIGGPASVHFFLQDSSAGSILINASHGLDRVRPFFEQTLYGAGYARGRPTDVLIIGLGGAPDVLTALYYGARHIDAVEINATTIDLVHRTFAEYLGNPYGQPGVRTHQIDGRTFLRQSDASYDLIQLSGVDTKSVFAAGALSVNENYLYTREAMADMLARLRDDGMIALLRFLDVDVNSLTSIAVAALRDAGVTAPERHVIVIAQGLWRTVLVKRTPFTPAEVGRIRSWAAAAGSQAPDIVLPMYDAIGLGLRHPMTVQYSPPPDPVATTPYLRALADGTLDAFIAGERTDFSARDDDRPFFFFRERPLNALRSPPWPLRVLGRVLRALVIASFLLILVPLLVLRWRGLGVAGVSRTLTYFTCLGAGFMLVEIGVIQHFVLLLGHQTYAVTVVLFGLLVGGGLGSVLSARVHAGGAGRVRLVFGALCSLIVAYALLLGHTFYAASALGFEARLGLALGLVAAPGVLLGMPFPLGLRTLQATAPRLAPWAIGVNGFASVVGATAAVPIAMLAGLRVLLLLALALYALAALTVPRSMTSS